MHSNPKEFGLVQCLTHSYICTSADGLAQLKIDELMEDILLEFKSLYMIVGKAAYKL